MKIVLQHLTKKFPARGPVRGRKNREDVIAVNDFDFEIPDGKLIAGYEGAWIYDKTQTVSYTHLTLPTICSV